MKAATSPQTTHEDLGSWPQVIIQQVESLRFGLVQIIVHDSKVVQIERTEKIRFSESARTSKPQSL